MGYLALLKWPDRVGNQLAMGIWAGVELALATWGAYRGFPLVVALGLLYAGLAFFLSCGGFLVIAAMISTASRRIRGRRQT